jgi:hypothetical protein
MTDTNRSHYDDDIDLFEVVEILWKSKWVIILSIFLSLIVAIANQASKPTVYLYSISYSTSLDSIGSSYICGIPDYDNQDSHKTCLNNYLLAELKYHFNEPFTHSFKNSKLEITSTNGNIKDQLQRDITQAVKEMTEALENDTQQELSLINAETPTQIFSTETVANNYIYAKRLLNSINNGRKAIEFQPVVKSVKSSRTSLVLTLSVLGGGMMGLFIVFVLRVAAAYKKREQKTT